MKGSFVCALLLMIVAFAALPGAADAQFVRLGKPTKDTLNNADTSIIKFGAVEDDAKAVTVVVVRASATASGKAFITGSVDGKNFLPVTDTFTLANQAVNAKKWSLGTLDFAEYQLHVISSSTTKLAPKGYLLRRRS